MSSTFILWIKVYPSLFLLISLSRISKSLPSRFLLVSFVFYNSDSSSSFSFFSSSNNSLRPLSLVSNFSFSVEAVSFSDSSCSIVLRSSSFALFHYFSRSFVVSLLLFIVSRSSSSLLCKALDLFSFSFSR